MSASHTLGMDKSGAEYVVVVVKGTYTIPSPGETAALAGEQIPLWESDQFAGEPGLSATTAECDYALEKPFCDLLLTGSAYAPGGRPVDRLAVELRVGEWRKAFTVWGNRTWLPGLRGVSPGTAEPFSRLPITYENAFGGTTRSTADPARIRCYLPNPVGRGWYPEPHSDLIIGTTVSNTEEIGDPVRNAAGCYRPMAFGPLGRGWPARLRHAGTYNQDWLDNVFPFLPADFDPRYFQCAPEDQQISPLRGGERVSMSNLTPDGWREFALPVVAMPVLFARRRAADVEQQCVLDTVMFEPDDARFTLVWRARLKIERDVFEVSEILVGHRSRARRRAIETGKPSRPVDRMDSGNAPSDSDK